MVVVVWMQWILPSMLTSVNEGVFGFSDTGGEPGPLRLLHLDICLLTLFFHVDLLRIRMTFFHVPLRRPLISLLDDLVLHWDKLLALRVIYHVYKGRLLIMAARCLLLHMLLVMSNFVVLLMLLLDRDQNLLALWGSHDIVLFRYRLRHVLVEHLLRLLMYIDILLCLHISWLCCLGMRIWVQRVLRLDVTTKSLLPIGSLRDQGMQDHLVLLRGHLHRGRLLVMYGHNLV